MSTDLIANVTFDICCHFGRIRNVDLCSRGFYYIETVLSASDGMRVPPVRCFSCPSSLSSCVRETQLQAAPLLHMCNVQDSERAFQCRSFMIRYKGEIHELNDGCCWKFTVLSYDVGAIGGTAPRSMETLVFRFRLMFCDVLDGIDGDMDSDPHLFVPDEPSWAVIAEQSIAVQMASSGLDEYFPVQFDRAHFVDLDCMIHCVVTDIVYSSSNLSKMVESYFAQPEVIQEAGASPVDSSDASLACDKSVIESKLGDVFDSLVVPVVCNAYLVNSSAAMLIKVCREYKDDASNSDKGRTSTKLNSLKKELVEDWTFSDAEIDTDRLSLRVEDSKLRCKSSSSPTEFVREICNFCEYSQSLCVKSYLSLLTMLPRFPKAICKYLKQKYSAAAHSFWRGQVLVHACRDEHLANTYPGEENALSLLQQHVQRELDSSFQYENLACQNTRGMRVYDYNVLQNISKLPKMVVQQYSNAIPPKACSVGYRGGAYVNCETDCQDIFVQGSAVQIGPPWTGSADLLGGGEETISNSERKIVDSPDGRIKRCETKAPHLIVLQHGFLGNHYDMRHLENAIAVELPYRSTHTLAISSNDTCSEEGISKMANNLVVELNEYIQENLPLFLDAKNEGYVSFIGHSLGGLVVRRALEDKDLHYLRHRCHTYVSLATPHMGTQYSASPLVATGMWAMAAWGKSLSLRELALADGLLGDRTRSHIYRLAENNVLALFNHVIVVSSPSDMYVPRYSAALRLSYANGSVAGDSVLQAIQRLVLAQVTPSKLKRITIGIDELSERSINTFIGRTAHICYLENPIVATMLICALVPFFTIPAI